MVGDTRRIDRAGVGPSDQGLDSLLRTETGFEDDRASPSSGPGSSRPLAASWWFLPAFLATRFTPDEHHTGPEPALTRRIDLRWLTRAELILPNRAGR